MPEMTASTRSDLSSQQKEIVSPASSSAAAASTLKVLQHPSTSKGDHTREISSTSSEARDGLFDESESATSSSQQPLSASSSRASIRRRASSEDRSTNTTSSTRASDIISSTSRRVESEPGKRRTQDIAETDRDGVSLDESSSDGGPERPRTPSATSSMSQEEQMMINNSAIGRDEADHARARETTITSPGESTDDTPILDHVLLSALQNPRDRILLLRAEVEMERFLAHPSASRLPLSPPHFQPNLNSYQRLLIHRLADIFGITREVEAAPVTTWVQPGTPTPGIVVLVKGPSTRMPSAKLAAIVPPPSTSSSGPASPAIIVPSMVSSNDPSPAQKSPGPATPARAVSPTPSSSQSSIPPPVPAQVFKILPRSTKASGSSPSSSSVGGEDDSNGSRSKARKELTLEEREAAYKEARERIFAQQHEAKATPSTSTSVVDPNVLGLTRPSSAGSAYSRGSAAASVAGGRAESTTSSYHSGYHQGPPSSSSSMFYPVPSLASSSSSLMSRSSLAASLRPSAPSFDPNGGWSQPGYEQEYYQQQQYYSGGLPSPQSGYPQTQSMVNQPFQQRGSYPPSQAGLIVPPPPPPPMPASSMSQAPYPHPVFAPAQSHHAHPEGYGLPPSAWNTPRPSASLPSPALSTSSGSSYISMTLGGMNSGLGHQLDRSGAPNGSSYLMRFPDGGIVPYSGATSTGTPSSTNSSQASLHAVNHAPNAISNRSSSSSSVSRSNLRSESGARGTSAASSRTSSSASLEGKRKPLDREGTVKGKGKELELVPTDSSSDPLSTANLKTLHPSLPAKPEWTKSPTPGTESKNGKRFNAEDLTTSPSPPVILQHQHQTQAQRSAPIEQYPPFPSSPASYYSHPSTPSYNPSVPPYPAPSSPASWYAQPHPPSLPIDPAYYPYMSASTPVSPNHMMGIDGGGAGRGEMRRPPPRNTELFDPTKASSTAKKASGGIGSGGNGKAVRIGSGNTALEKGVEGLRL